MQELAARRARLDNHTNRSSKQLMKQRVGPARPRADGAVNFKKAVNPANASASRAVCLVFAENHYFAEIYAVLEESAGAWHGQGFYSRHN
jgi:hypothetical protein